MRPELLDAAVAVKYRDALVALLAPRITIAFDGTPVTIVWGAIDVVPERQSVRLAFSIAQPPPGHTSIDAYVFPYDPIHQTFVNLYEDDALKLQAILDASRQRVEYYAGTTQGRIAVIRTFVLSGIEHILIGPDHILFLIGLLLLMAFRDAADALLMLMCVPGALAGAVLAQWLCGFPFSLAIGVGYIACLGMAAATGDGSARMRSSGRRVTGRKRRFTSGAPKCAGGKRRIGAHRVER